MAKHRIILGTVNVVRDLSGHVLHLPFIERVTHHKSRKPLLATGIGFVVMAVGSSVACEATLLSHATHIPHFIIDMGAYLVHGIGAIPIAKYCEPVWLILMGSVEAEGE